MYVLVAFHQPLNELAGLLPVTHAFNQLVQGHHDPPAMEAHLWDHHQVSFIWNVLEILLTLWGFFEEPEQKEKRQILLSCSLSLC